jgi:pyridoxal 5'-phosphate synthase pdxT subunit
VSALRSAVGEPEAPAAGARVGVLGLQGDFKEHLAALTAIGAAAVDVRRREQVDDLDALIIPGGESTTIGKLADLYGISERIRERAKAGMPVWGTCAGAIVLAKRVPGRPQPLLGLMDITVERNAFGRQVDSFEADLRIESLGEEAFHAVFIRAPKITDVGPSVDVISRLDDGTIVAARQDNLLVTSFHPELTGDARFHRYFCGFIARR